MYDEPHSVRAIYTNPMLHPDSAKEKQMHLN